MSGAISRMISAICSAALVEVDLSATAIRIAQPAMLRDAQDPQTRGEFRLADAGSCSGGHRVGSVTPSSPRVAVTQTTREPAAVAIAMIPPHR